MSEFYMTVDVEDWFHTHNLDDAIAREDWATLESRVLENTDRLLELFDTYDARATFFVLGWVADNYPEVVRQIDEAGHEIASHGYDHKLLYEKSATAIKDDLKRSLAAIETETSQTVRGYRAPSFSITTEATDQLLELGFEYDSSLFRVTGHDRYGSVDVSSNDTFATLDNGLREVQLPVFDAAGFNVPWAGGAYFRLIPYRAYRRGVRRAARDGPFVFYLHPWEIDPNQPRVSDVKWSYRMRHYTNLDRTEARLERLLDDFQWSAIEDAL
jgi:polysaccharide deacetylase family protein (PEP-CTERM system associated)